MKVLILLITTLIINNISCFSQSVFQLGVDNVNNQEYKSAEHLFTKAIDENAANYEAYAYRAIVRNLLGNKEGAGADMDTVKSINPESIADIYFALGQITLGQRKFEQAIEYLNKLEKEDSKFKGLYFLRATAYFYIQNNKAAIEDYTKSIKLQTNAEAYYSRGVCKINIEKYKKAIKDFDKAIKINPDISVYYYNRGLARLVLKDFDDADTDMNKAIDIDPDNAAYYSTRGIARFGLQNKKEACNDWEKAKTLGSVDAVSYLQEYCN